MIGAVTMWFDRMAREEDWKAARRHLRRADPVLRRVIDKVGPCTLTSRGDPFIALCQAIFSQQLSTKVANVLFGRFKKLFPREKPTPARVLKMFTACDPAVPRSCGLSRQKLGYILDLAEKFDSNKVPLRRFARMNDEEIIEALLPIKGVGRWTAEMFFDLRHEPPG